MASAPRLNVYVTPAGFYDAVVAAPNQRAALEAWGAHADLFAQKLAAPETDQAWRERALASPGEVLKKPRGDAAELLARPKPGPNKPAAAMARPASKASVRPAPPKPPPDRSKLGAAEAAVAAADAKLEQTRSDYARRRRELEAEAQDAISAAEQDAQRAEAAHKREIAAYKRASRC